jgi:hypothetical protein
MLAEMPSNVVQFDTGSDDLEMVDAQATLARALVKGAAPVNQRTVEAAMFLRLYLGDEGVKLADYAMSFKDRQAPGYMKHIRESLKSLAALDLIRPFTIGGGTGGGK